MRAPRGTTILLVLAVMTALAAISAVVFMRVQAAEGSTQDEWRRAQLLWLARSGVTEGKARSTKVKLQDGAEVAVSVKTQGSKLSAVASHPSWGEASVTAEKSGQAFKSWDERYVSGPPAR